MIRRIVMPKGDGTGPKGKGPRTGRGLGKAAGNKSGQNIGKSQLQSGAKFGAGQNKNNIKPK